MNKSRYSFLWIVIPIALIYQVYKYPEKQKRKEIIALYKEGEFLKCKNELETYLVENPKSKGMRTFLGTVYLELEDTVNAKRAYLEGVELDGRDDKAIVGLGLIARMEGQYQKARDNYYKALELNPRNAEAYSSLLVLELKDKNYSKAVELGEKAKQLLKPESSLGILGNLAIAYHFNKQFKERDQVVSHLKENNYQDMEYLNMILDGTLGLELLFN